MYRPLFFHFVGIGGVGMSGIAEVLLNQGYRVSGSDLKSSTFTDHLRELGVHVSLGHARDNIPSEATVVVISSAVSMENPEVLEGQSRGLPIVRRAEVLGELMRTKYGIAIAGAHGKTTTSTMITEVLRGGNLDPTAIIGGRVMSGRSGARLGAGDFLVAESDESDGSFLLLRPAIAVVTNIDAEHLGFYGSFGKLEEAFHQFMKQVPFYGAIVACLDDPVVRRLSAQVSRRVISYGLSPEHKFSAAGIEAHRGATEFTLLVEGESVGRFRLPVCGPHMVCNALAAIAVGSELEISPVDAVRTLQSFPGVARRSQVISAKEGVMVIDDYAHHPAELRATLRGIRSAYVSDKGRLIALFQPHRYSRTQELFGEFVNAFSEADEVVVGEIYAAGESPIEGISGEKLASAIQHPRVQFVSDLNDALSGLRKSLRSGDVVLTLGAGSVSNVAHKLGELLEKGS